MPGNNQDMPAAKFKTQIRSGQTQVGQSLSVTVTTPTGRILGVVELQIPLLPGFSLEERIGKQESDRIVAEAKDLARRIAEGVLTEPARKSA
jgi:hypothetical protein